MAVALCLVYRVGLAKPHEETYRNPETCQSLGMRRPILYVLAFKLTRIRLGQQTVGTFRLSAPKIEEGRVFLPLNIAWQWRCSITDTLMKGSPR